MMEAGVLVIVDHHPSYQSDGAGVLSVLNGDGNNRA